MPQLFTLPRAKYSMRYNELISEEGRVVAGVNTTADVGPNEIQKQAAKWGFKVSKDGVPETVYTQTTAAQQIIKESADPLKAKLEAYFNDPDHIPDRYNRSEGMYCFPDAWASGVCTNWQRYVRRIVGPQRVAFFGTNGGKTSYGSGGHDFAVVDERYIVDGWLHHVAQLHGSAVLDMKDPANQSLIKELYGDPATWKRDEFGHEATTDQETPKERKKAMRGVKPFDHSASG